MKFRIFPEPDVVYSTPTAYFFFEIQRALENYANNLRFETIDKCAYQYKDQRYFHIARVLKIVAEGFRQFACFIGSRAWRKLQKNPQIFDRPSW